MAEITKNQHFVPRLLLKHYAGGEDCVVQIYDSLRNQLRPPTSIRRVFAQNFFYDDDNCVEKFLAEYVENPAASLIKSVVDSPKSPIQPGNIDLLCFISAQMNRTPQSLGMAVDLIDKDSSLVFQQLGKLNGFLAEDMAGIKLKMTDERVLLAMQTIEGALNWPLLVDLSWHVLSNATALPFVISDHPVIHYNWYLRNANDVSYTSLTNFGVQIFLPLSPQVTLALIDQSTYKFGAKGTFHTVLRDVSDIEVLNSLQFRSRQTFIVFPDGMNSSYVEERCRRWPANSLFLNHAWASRPEESGNDELKSTHVVWRTQTKLPRWISISKIKRKVAKKALVCDDRKPEVVEAHKLFVERTRRRNDAR